MRRFLALVLPFLLSLACGDAWGLSARQIVSVLPPYQAPGYTGFTPNSLFAALWSADSTSDGAVSSWPDLVTSSPLAQATGGFQPTSGAANLGYGVKAMRAVLCDGIDDYLRVASPPAGVPIGANPSEIWLVVQQPVPSSNATTFYVADYGSTSGTTRRTAQRIVTGGMNRLRSHANAVNNDNKLGDLYGTRIIASFWTANAIQGRIGGRVNDPTAVTLNTISGNISLCSTSGSTPTGFANVAVRYFGITTGTLTEAQHKKVEAWFAWHSGPINFRLPFDQPYRFRAP